jgi:hypothetical protein
MFDPLTWIVGWAFVLRVCWVFRVPSHPVGDFALYRESAAYLLDQGRFDSEFIYMPGYIFLLAAVQALGGGLLAQKMIGVVASTIIVGSVGGIANVVFGRRAGIIATVATALWPAGIAVVSVTGTDVPAGALVVLGVFVLVRVAPRRPWLAAVLCGVLMGLAAWVRAVAAPLAALSMFYWLASGTRWQGALTRGATAAGIAMLMLLPWGLRNKSVYGEFFLTDSHGGATALVGANPNSEGTYSRSLNLMFAQTTGYRTLETTERHRASERAAYALAKQWSAFEPAYALGLIGAKADRLLTHERNLLYWPVFRQGVLSNESRAFFDAHRGALEFLADGFWWLMVGLAAAGVVVSVARRAWLALALLIFPAALTAIYTLFFSEVRYHLAIAPLLLPYAAFAMDCGWSIARRRADGVPIDKAGYKLCFTIGAVAALYGGWSAFLAVGSTLRNHHRWAVTVCAYPQSTDKHLCEWRRVVPLGGDSPVRGVWDGVGLRFGTRSANDVMASARTDIPVDAGRLRARAAVSVAGGSLPVGAISVALRLNGRVVARVVPPAASAAGASGDSLPLEGVIEHAGGLLGVEIEVEPGGNGSIVDGGTVWISQLVVERF